MIANGGKRLSVQDRLSSLDVPAAMPQPQPEELLDQLAERLGERIQGALRDELSRRVFPRLDELESKLQDAAQQIGTLARPVSQPPAPPAGEGSLQRRARTRVD